MKELELYLHIPFCVKKCNYCDFLSAYADEKSQSAYMESLQNEIDFYRKQLTDRVISTIFIGGGTPSWVKAEYIEELLNKVRQSFNIDEKAEITIECNPGTLTKEKLKCYKRCGINRLSIGLQSADDEELKNLGRIHTFAEFLENYALARECGFTNINIDLMHGLPGQTVEKFQKTLEQVIALNPEHISAYSLIIEEGTPFFDWYEADLLRQEDGKETKFLPNEDTVYQICKFSQKYLEKHGYKRYEVSNFAKEGYACRHNIGYWQRKDYLGIGLGAASLLENVRYSNICDLQEYMRLFGQERKCTSKSAREAVSDREIAGNRLYAETEKLDKNARMEEFMFLGLRMTEGVLKSRFLQEFGSTMDCIYGDVLTKMEKEKLLVNGLEQVYLTDKGMDISNYVLAQFLL